MIKECNETCAHIEIIFRTSQGKHLKGNVYEKDFVVECDICQRELFRISEWGRSVLNLTTH